MAALRPTWYAGGDSPLGEAWTMLHLPYTLMVLSFVIVGAVLSPVLSWGVLLATLTAYFLALGVGSHFLDQLPGMGSRYVRHWKSRALWTIGLGAVGAGVGLGILGVILLNRPDLLILVGVQATVAVGYPLAPVFRRAFHRDSVFAISWGSLPCLTSYYAQAGSISAIALVAAGIIAAIALVEIRTSRVSRQRRGVRAPDRDASAVSSVPQTPDSRVPDAVLMLLSTGTVLVAVITLGARMILGI